VNRPRHCDVCRADSPPNQYARRTTRPYRASGERQFHIGPLHCGAYARPTDQAREQPASAEIHYNHQWWSPSPPAVSAAKQQRDFFFWLKSCNRIGWLPNSSSAIGTFRFCGSVREPATGPNVSCQFVDFKMSKQQPRPPVRAIFQASRSPPAPRSASPKASCRP